MMVVDQKIMHGLTSLMGRAKETTRFAIRCDTPTRTSLLFGRARSKHERRNQNSYGLEPEREHANSATAFSLT